MKLPFFTPPTVATLEAEELAELQRLRYLEDKRADYHAAQVRMLDARIAKLQGKAADERQRATV